MLPADKQKLTAVCLMHIWAAERGLVVRLCMRKVPGRLPDRWDCRSWAREELIPSVLTPLISEGTGGRARAWDVTVMRFVCVF